MAPVEWMDMDEGTPDQRARKMASAILSACRSATTQAAVAAAIGVSESTMSSMLSQQLDKFCLLLAHSGLKVVDRSMRCFPSDYVQALHTMAKLQLQHTSPETLKWDEV